MATGFVKDVQAFTDLLQSMQDQHDRELAWFVEGEQYSADDLYCLVSHCEVPDEIEKGIRIVRSQKNISTDLYDDLMMYLSQAYREFIRFFGGVR